MNFYRVKTELVNRVWEYSKTNPDGKLKVALEKDGLKKVISHALKHDNIVGGGRVNKI